MASPSDESTGTGVLDPAAFDRVLVVDFGAQYAQLIARRVREAHVYSEIVPHSITAAEVGAMRPKGIVLSGGPMSVYADAAPSLDPEVYALGVPVLGICYGAQLLTAQLGGEVARTGAGEYGRTSLRLAPGATSSLFEGWAESNDVWMSHADSIVAAPAGLRRHGLDGRGRRGGARGPGAAPVRRPVPPRGRPHRPGPGAA